MRRLLPAILMACTIPFVSFGQVKFTQSKTQLSQLHETRWIDLREQSVTPEQVIAGLKQEYASDFTVESAPAVLKSNGNDTERTLVKQTVGGLEVEFAQVYIHHRNGVAEKVNGVVVPDVQVEGFEPQLTEEEALALAIECVGAGSYYWEHPLLEQAKQYAVNDKDATFYPDGQLLIADQDFDHRSPDDFRLAWKFEIYSREPESRDWVYVDAMTGEIFKELNLNHTEAHTHTHTHTHTNTHTHSQLGFTGTAETRYNGTREIITDTADGQFVLRDYTRGFGIETFDAQDSFSTDYALDFYDDDNFWANVNERKNDAATDAHFASEQLYDYLLAEYGLDSYDGQGSRMISYIHYGENWRNASWNGFWGQYGNATGDPWVYCDVVAHEYAHGFTWATCALLYTRESGALNESFSDILGEALERYIYGDNDWYATPAPSDTIRAYLDPNSFEDPDTYLGDFWQTESFDNFGVHSNSAVGNLMFYLLSEGGSGTNDYGEGYTVDPIGFKPAMDMLMRVMTVYLFPTAGYPDARQAYLFAAEDLFGACSEEYRQVANAWHAVGVGQPSNQDDFTVIGIAEKDICGVGDQEPLTLFMQHLGCEATGPVTIDINILKSNPPQSYNETVEISSVEAGQIFEVTLAEEFNFSRTGEHTITARISSENDLNTGNDVSDEVIVYNPVSPELQTFSFYTNFAPRTFRDTMIIKESQFASVMVRADAGKDNTAGIMIEGDRSRYANPVLPGQDPFDLNERLGTEICFCVDATNYDSLGFQFDLRQTYSNDFERSIGYEQPPTSAMRLKMNEEEIARYFPETNRDDDWQTHNFDFSEYTGLNFLLCMETRTIQSLAADDDTIGDRVFLDNIRFTGSLIETSVLDIEPVEKLSLFPNPASDNVSISIDLNEVAKGTLSMYDMAGRLVSQDIRQVSAGMPIELDLAGMSEGVYLVKFNTEEKQYAGKLIVQ